MILYGIPTCDTCRKALTALRAAGHAPDFRDIRAEPLAAREIAEFLDVFGERLVNRASTTWRNLAADDRDLPPAELLRRYPALMKRPVIRSDRGLTLGWSAATAAHHGAG
ncbi:MAG: arsenate reductase family protein [Gemmobacter sp.]